MKLPEGITAVIKRNFTVATIAGRSKEEEAAPVATAATAEGAPAEGTTAAPGAAPAAGAEGTAPAAKKDEKK
jgi:hypothetical protein